MKCSIFLLTFLSTAVSYAQFDPSKISIPIPQFYELVGISGKTEKFEADNRTKAILWSNADKLLTIVQKAVSTYNNNQYVIFDNYFFDDDNSIIRQEATAKTIFMNGERELDWRWMKAIRLSNNDVLLAVRVRALHGEYMNRFLSFNSIGSKINFKQDYYLPGIADIVSKENGEFLIVAERNFVPIYLPNYNALEHNRLSGYQDMFMKAYASTSLLHFSNAGRLVSKHDYNVHDDPKISPDIYMDILQYRDNYYVLTTSNLVGTLNTPTLIVLKIDKNDPNTFSNKIIQEANIYNSKSYLKVFGIKVYVELTNGYVNESKIAEN